MSSSRSLDALRTALDQLPRPLKTFERNGSTILYNGEAHARWIWRNQVEAFFQEERTFLRDYFAALPASEKVE